MDHIPPRCLFSRPLPSNLITVPACTKCHGEMSKDDEYLRVALQMREGIEEHPDVIKSRPTLLRSLEKPEAVGMRKSLLASILVAEQCTPSGIFIKNGLAMKTRMDRVDRVVARIVRGLFYKHKGYVVPSGYDVVAGSEETVDKSPPDLRTALYEGVLNPMLATAPVRIGEGVFSFRLGFEPRDPNITCWILVFYEQAGFLGMTFPISCPNPSGGAEVFGRDQQQ
jgi:hypothetical protein